MSMLSPPGQIERHKKDWIQARRRKDPVVYSVYSVSTTMMQLRPERLAL